MFTAIVSIVIPLRNSLACWTCLSFPAILIWRFPCHPDAISATRPSPSTPEQLIRNLYLYNTFDARKLEDRVRRPKDSTFAQTSFDEHADIEIHV